MMRCTILAILALGLVPTPGWGQAGAPPARKARRAPPKVSEIFDLDGYFRVRGSLLHNLDLDRGPTPTTGQPIFPIPASDGQILGSADARLRADLHITVGSVVTAKVRLDALDGLVLGSTPEGFPPTRWTQQPWATTRQIAPASGFNAFVDSIRVKEAWGQVMTPVGALAFGRMDLPAWGLGMMTGRAEDLDDDWDNPVDRLAFVTSLADHLIGVAFDINAVGPISANSKGGLTTTGQPIDLQLEDNVYGLSLSFLRDHGVPALRRRQAAGKATVSYGAFATWRWQALDFPDAHVQGLDAYEQSWSEDDAVPRKLHAVVGDGWVRLAAGPLRLEVEAAYAWARVGDPSPQAAISLPALTSSQFGAVLEAEVEIIPDRVFVELGGGLATGDSAPGLGIAPPVGQATSQPGDLDGPQFDYSTGDHSVNNFRFHPGYRVDLVFWRSIAGAITDAAFVRPELTLRPDPHFEAVVSGIVSLAMKPAGTPGRALLYGGEIDVSARWTPVPGFEGRLDYGVFLPGGALANLDLDVSAQPAQVLRGVLGVKW